MRQDAQPVMLLAAAATGGGGGGGAGHVREQGGVRVAALRPAGDQGARRVHL